VRKIQFALLMVIFLWLVLAGKALSFYYPPTHTPPDDPPNYTQIDSTYFLGTPLPVPVHNDSGGIFIWYSGGMWNVANHIYTKGLSHEQFHCCILVEMDQPPALNVNVFAENFELSEDTTKPECLKQNDRWGWKPWGGNLYEIWWDVTTRVGKGDYSDLDDFLRITVAGCAVDFNLWSSGHGKGFGPHEVFLGANMTRLSEVPEYYDYFEGIDDPYQSQAGSDPSNTPNVTIFTQYSDTLRSYSQLGLIDSTDSYSCELAVDYGQRYAGTFAYEGNGIQFSTQCVLTPNHPPHVQLPADTSVVVCTLSSFCIDVFASDPDPQDSITLEKTFGQGVFAPVTDTTPISTTHCFFPDTSGSYMFVFEVTDKGGLSHSDTSLITVEVSVPPILSVPADFDTFMCDTATICFSIEVDDPEDNSVVTVDPPAWYNLQDGSVCFPAYQETDYCFEIVATDACGAADTGEICIGVDLNDPPVISGPDTVVVYLDTSAQYTVTASDPDGETLQEYLNVTESPDCGYYSIQRLNGSGTSSGEWEITFEANECTVGYYVMAFEVEDSCGKTGSHTTTIEIRLPSSVDEEKVDKTAGFFLRQNYPNPFNLSTEISFQLPRDCKVDLKIYNLKGQLVKTVAEKEMNRGTHTVYWDGTDSKGSVVASGIYFYKLSAPNFTSVRKMILLK